MKFGQSACMFRISYGFQCCQYRRFIADSTPLTINISIVILNLNTMNFVSLTIRNFQNGIIQKNEDQ